MNPIISRFSRLEPYAPVVLRLGLAFVFAWFGATQLLGPQSWTALIPQWVTNISGMSALTVVYINGVFEVIAAILLVLGVWTRLVAFLLFLHLLTIVFDLGLNAIGVRDIGLSVAALTLALWGNGPAERSIV